MEVASNTWGDAALVIAFPIFCCENSQVKRVAILVPHRQIPFIGTFQPASENICLRLPPSHEMT